MKYSTIKLNIAESAKVTGQTKVYQNRNAFPAGDTTWEGTYAFAQDSDRLYLHTGTGWHNIAIINTNPIWVTQPAGSYELATDATGHPQPNTGTATEVILRARDSEGAAIIWSAVADADFNNIARITQDSTGTNVNKFTIEPFSEDSVGGGTTSGTVTFKASDGVNILSQASTFTLIFDTTVPDSENTWLMMGGYGNGLTSGHTTTAYVDEKDTSSKDWRTGATQTTQGSYSPYTPGGHSWYFDGSNDYVQITDNLADFEFGTGDFCIEMWYYSEDFSGTHHLFGMQATAYAGNEIFIKNKNNGWIIGGSNENLIGNTSQSHVNGGLEEDENQWHHIAWVRHGSNIKFYIDGVLSGTTAISGVTSFTRTGNIYFGRNPASAANYYKGYLHDIRVVKGHAVYTANFTPPTSQLGDAASGTTVFRSGGMPSCDRVKDLTGRHTIMGYPSAQNGPSTVPWAPYRIDPYDRTKHGGSMYKHAPNNNSWGHWLHTNGGSDFSDFAISSSEDFSIEAWIRLQHLNGNGGTTIDTHDTVIFNAHKHPYNSGRNGKLWFGFWQGNLILSKGTSTGPSYDWGDLQFQTWYHIAGCRVSGTSKLYINGIEVASSSALNGESLAQTGGSIGYDLFGWISDFRFIKGTSAYTGEFTPPTLMLSDTGGTYPSNTNVNTSITASHTKTLLHFRNGGIYDKTGNHSLGLTVTSPSEIGSHTSVQKYSVPSINMPSTSTGYLKMTTATEPMITKGPGKADYTIECWVYIDSDHGSNDGGIFQFSDASWMSFGNDGPGIKDKNNRWYFTKETTSAVEVDSLVSVAYTQWIHLAMSRTMIKGNKQRTCCYVNGTMTNLWYDDVDIGNREFVIGGSEDSKWMKGKMSDFRITRGRSLYPFNPKKGTLTTTTSHQAGQTVTASNVKLLTCHAASVSDGGATGHTVNANNGAAVSSFAPRGDMYSVYFDGTDDFVQAPSAAHTDWQFGTGAFCIEFWIWRDRTSNAAETLFGHHDYSENSKMAAWIRSDNNQLIWGSKGQTTLTDSGIQIPFKKWTHLAFCRKGTGSNEGFIFVNGTQVSNFTNDANYSTTSSAWRIGYLNLNGAYTNGYFKGYISNFRIVKGQGVYDQDIQVPQAALMTT